MTALQRRESGTRRAWQARPRGTPRQTSGRRAARGDFPPAPTRLQYHFGTDEGDRMKTLPPPAFPPSRPKRLRPFMPGLASRCRGPSLHRGRDARRHQALGARDRRSQIPTGWPRAWRRPPSSSPWTASSRATWAGSPASTRCTRAPTSAGSGRSGSTTRSWARASSTR